MKSLKRSIAENSPAGVGRCRSATCSHRSLMPTHARTSSEALAEQVPGKLLAAGRGRAWKDLLVQIFSRQHVEESIIVPAVAEPLIVWVLSGAARVEERELNGVWTANSVEAGDFFLTTSPTPYELRWRANGVEPFEVMQLYLGLSIFKRASEEVLGKGTGVPRLREISGQKDAVLSQLLELLRIELTSRRKASALFVQGLGQSIAIHLVREYADKNAAVREQQGGLPAFKLRKVTDLMEQQLDEEFTLERLAREAGMSVFHFSRLFKKATGFSPSRYFIRLRIAKACRLLRETSRSVIDIGLDVGYMSPSHFAQIFRRETGVPPTRYRE
jgi:AraC family transcriptional regulator